MSTFHHPSYTHPYSRVRHWFTPIRWIFYLASAAIGWCGVLPTMFLTWMMRGCWHFLLTLVDRFIVAPKVFINGVDISQLDPESIGCMHTVAPQDCMWLDRYDTITATATTNVNVSPNSLSPGASSCNLIHAVLAFSRPVTLAQLKSAMLTRFFTRRIFDRFTWTAVERVTVRKWLPSRFGIDTTKDYAWCDRTSIDGKFTTPERLDAHVRLVRNRVWMNFEDVTSKRKEDKREGLEKWRESRRRRKYNEGEEHLDRMLSSDASIPISTLHDSPSISTSPLPTTLAVSLDHVALLRRAKLQAYLAHLSSTPLRSGQPLWELLLLEGDSDEDHEKEGNECIAIFRCSHAVADGVLLSGIILKTFLQEGDAMASSSDSAKAPTLKEVKIHRVNVDEVATEEKEAAPISASSQAPTAPLHDSTSSASSQLDRRRDKRRSLPSCSSRLLSLLRVILLWLNFFLTGPYLILHKSFQPDDENILHPLESSSTSQSSSASSSHKDICWSSTPFPLARVKLISHRLNVTLNDLVMNIWLEIVDRYMMDCEVYLEEQLNEEKNGQTNRSQQYSLVQQQAKRKKLAPHYRAPDSVFVIVPFNVRSEAEMNFQHKEDEAEEAGSSEPKKRRTQLELGNKFALLLVDVPMGAALLPTQQLKSPTSFDATDEEEKDDTDRSLPSRSRKRKEYSPVASSTSTLTSGSSSLSTPFLRRLSYLSGYMSHVKSASLEPLLMYGGVSLLLRCLPASLSGIVLDAYSSMCSVVLTNNRSPERPLFLVDGDGRTQTSPQAYDDAIPAASFSSAFPSASHSSSSSTSSSASSSPPRLLYWVSWAPQRSRVGLCVTILTYQNELRVSIVTDHATLRYTTAAHMIREYQERLEQLAQEVEAMQRSEPPIIQ